MNRRKKIHISYLVDGFRLGGAETKLLELISRIDKERYTVSVCSLLELGSLQTDFESLGIPVHVFSRKHRFDVTLIPKLIAYFRRERVGILQTTLFYADMVGPLAARFAGVPVVISWETCSHYYDFFAPKRRGTAYKASMKLVDKIAVVSREIGQSLVDLRGIAPGKIETIHYGVDLSRFGNHRKTDKRQELGIDGGVPVIGIVARLDPVKGHRYFIDALPKITESFPGLCCLFIGDGEHRNELENRCRRLGVEHAVRFLGFRDDVSAILPVLDLFVLPSVSEGLPNVILEAMASAVPVIASSVGGIPEAVLHEKTGLLVPPENSEAIGSAVLDLLGHQRKRKALGASARQWVEESFSLNQQIKAFHILYETLYNHHS